jgi:hypothetical protein
MYVCYASLRFEIPALISALISYVCTFLSSKHLIHVAVEDEIY